VSQDKGRLPVLPVVLWPAVLARQPRLAPSPRQGARESKGQAHSARTRPSAEHTRPLTAAQAVQQHYGGATAMPATMLLGGGGIERVREESGSVGPRDNRTEVRILTAYGVKSRLARSKTRRVSSLTQNRFAWMDGWWEGIFGWEGWRRVARAENLDRVPSTKPRLRFWNCALCAPGGVTELFCAPRQPVFGRPSVGAQQQA